MTYIFDLDGTLIDSTKRHWLLMMHILRQYNVSVNDGFGLDFITYKSYGNSGYDYLTNVLIVSLIFDYMECSPTGVIPSGEHCCQKKELIRWR